jgi:hypothetical protein
MARFYVLKGRRILWNILVVAAAVALLAYVFNVEEQEVPEAEVELTLAVSAISVKTATTPSRRGRRASDTTTMKERAVTTAQAGCSSRSSDWIAVRTIAIPAATGSHSMLPPLTSGRLLPRFQRAVPPSVQATKGR